MDERAAVAALVEDLHWQIDQMKPRGIRDAAGNPYNPSYYKRGLENAIGRGDRDVVEYIRGYLSKPPSEGFKKLERADSLDLACEALVEDEAKPYSGLFTDDDRKRARRRLAPYRASIYARRQASQARVDAVGASLPEALDALQALAADLEGEPERAIAVNLAIAERLPGDAVTHLRLGRAYEALGERAEAASAFEAALAADPGNRIATTRLARLRRRG